MLIATATHVVSLGTVSVVVVATVLKLVSETEMVGVLKTNDALLFVVQLIGVPDAIDVNKDDEVVVSKADVAVSIGDDMLEDVVLIVVAEFEYPPKEAGMLLYTRHQTTESLPKSH